MRLHKYHYKKFLTRFFVYGPLLFLLCLAISYFSSRFDTHYVVIASRLFFIYIYLGIIAISIPFKLLATRQMLNLSLPISKAEYAHEYFSYTFRVYGLCQVPVALWIIISAFITPELIKSSLPLYISIFAVQGLVILSMISLTPIIGSNPGFRWRLLGAVIVIAYVFSVFLFAPIGSLRFDLRLLVPHLLINLLVVYFTYRMSISYARLRADY